MLNRAERNKETPFTDEEREELGLAQKVRTENYSTATVAVSKRGKVVEEQKQKMSKAGKKRTKQVR